jgi:hypothetical protein
MQKVRHKNYIHFADNSSNCIVFEENWVVRLFMPKAEPSIDSI